MSAYETASGEALLAVEALCRHLIGGGGFAPDTQPTDVEVERMRDMTYYKIAAALVDSGYSVTQTEAAVLGFLQNIQVLEIAILVELANPTSGPGEPNTRFLEFVRQRDSLYSMLSTSLLALGATAASDSTATSSGDGDVRGVSIAEKDAVYVDDDFVRPRFRRGSFAVPGTEPSSGVVGS